MLQQNELFNGTYRVLQQIGQGGTAVVYLAYHLRLQKYVVLKRISVGQQGLERLRVETDVLKNLHHPCLPQVYDFLCDGPEVYTVMDYVEGTALGDLPAGPGQWPEAQLLRWLRQMCEVLDYLHTRRPPILHSDIKPDNIIRTPSGQLCLIDFNISLDATRPWKIMGYSENFASPEQAAMAGAVLRGQPVTYALDARTDLYSMAATFYYLMTGIVPDSSRPAAPLSAMTGLPYSPGLCAVLDRAMAWDRAKRYASARRMLAALDHLKRQDARYRRYMVLQGASWLCGALLLSAGAFCMVRGVQEDRRRDYRQALETFLAAAQQPQQALRLGQDLLEEARFRAILQNQPQDEALILHALGDSCYALEDLGGAEGYYAQALEALPSTAADRDVYYLDYAIALGEDGRPEQAGQVLERARAQGIAAPACAVIQASLAAAAGDRDTCLREAQTVLDESTDGALCRRACLAAAQALADDPAGQVPWLERARQYGDQPRVLRQLGAAYAALAGTQGSADRQQQYAQKALDCFAVLCGGTDPAPEDRLNLAIAYYMLGRYEDCLQQLGPCEHEWPDDYRVQAYMALARHALGDKAGAAVHCSSALRSFSDLTQTERDAADAALIAELDRLRRILNI